MKTVPDAPPTFDEPTRPRRQVVAAVVAAFLLVVAVTAAILVFGLVPLPPFPALSADPDPSIPGTVAYVEQAREEQCVMTVPAGGGEENEVGCERFGGFDQGLAWTSDGLIVALFYGEVGPEIIVYDPHRGEVERISYNGPGVRARPPPESLFIHQDRTTRDDGTVLRTDRQREDRTVLRARSPDGTWRELLSVEGPRDYEFTAAQWSPDGAWILLADSRGRLVVLGENGADPRILVDAGQRSGWWMRTAAWHIPGDDTYTVDLDEVRGD